jgi:hypothetical protein
MDFQQQRFGKDAAAYDERIRSLGDKAQKGPASVTYGAAIVGFTHNPSAALSASPEGNGCLTIICQR